jgi:predicted dehydrogenase
MVASSEYRVGLIGYGQGGRWFHAPLISSAPDVTFAGVVTTSATRRSQLMMDHPGVPAMDSVVDLIRSGVDLVTLSVPPEGRADLVKVVLDAGVAVVVDKPFAMDASEASMLVDYAARRGVPIAAFHNRRWDSESRTMEVIRNSGVVGRSALFESSIERWEPGVAVTPTGGGYLLDLGSHLIDQALHVFGPATRVYGEISRTPGYSHETGFFISLLHASGLRSHLRGNCLQPIEGPRMRLVGSTATAVIEGLDIQTAQAFAGESPASLGSLWGVEAPDRAAEIRGPNGVSIIARQRGMWDQYYPQTLSAIASGRPLPVDGLAGVAVLRIIDGVRESERRGGASIAL